MLPPGRFSRNILYGSDYCAFSVSPVSHYGTFVVSHHSDSRTPPPRSGEMRSRRKKLGSDCCARTYGQQAAAGGWAEGAVARLRPAACATRSVTHRSPAAARTTRTSRFYGFRASCSSELDNMRPRTGDNSLSWADGASKNVVMTHTHTLLLLTREQV